MNRSISPATPSPHSRVTRFAMRRYGRSKSPLMSAFWFGFLRAQYRRMYLHN